MDALISKLNQLAQEKINQSGVTPKIKLEQSDFKPTFDDTLTNRLMDKMNEIYGLEDKNAMTVLSADDIHVTMDQAEMGTQSFDPGERFFDTFKEVNKSFVSLDSAIETLTAPGLKISPRQLLALQAGVANTTILAEGFSKFTSSVARGIQTLMQSHG